LSSALFDDFIDPSLLMDGSSSATLDVPPFHLSATDLTPTLIQDDGYTCKCQLLNPPPQPMANFHPPSVCLNYLRLDVFCALAALLQNCLHLNIPKSMFCADESDSLFYRPISPPASHSNSGPPSPDSEQAVILRNAHTLYRDLKPDLRPLTSQIVVAHHPYIDALPFPSVRHALIQHQGLIDEDEFLHDFFYNAICWGGAKGSRGGGMPWEGRNWELSEYFLSKWKDVVGDDDGEAVRSSRWWRRMRGDPLHS
jgi:hypothetical protein